MSIEREILRRLHESNISESFVHGGYKYWKYDGVCYRAKLTPTGKQPLDNKEEVSDDDYYNARDTRNSSRDQHKDLDDETVHDVKRMSHALLKIDKDEDLSPNDKIRYKDILNSYLAQSQEHNIPIKDYKPRDKRSKIQYSELNYILTKYTPPLAASDYNKLQTYDPVRRKYK